MAEPRNGYKSSLMDTMVPSQLNEDELNAELEIETAVYCKIDASGVLIRRTARPARW
jgi:hypothetical protein